MNNTGLEHFLGPRSRSSAGVTWWYTDTSYGQIPVHDIFSIRILAKSQYTGNPSIRILAKSQYTGRIRILLRIHAPPGHKIRWAGGAGGEYYVGDTYGFIIFNLSIIDG